MSFTIRLLTDRDDDLFENFLNDYAATSMFMRSNARRAGLEFRKGQEFSAYYWGAFYEKNLKGIMALNWNGNLYTQVPQDNVLSDLFETIKQEAPENYSLKGILGPVHQCQQILSWLSLHPSSILISSIGMIYSLTLKNMTEPLQLLEGKWICRQATLEDLNLLTPWRLSFEAETMNIKVHPFDAFEKTQQDLSNKILRQEIFILEDQGVCVASAGYNATLPELYQIGGVWTPPEFRGRGYARGAVAGALKAAQRQGVEAGILFTQNPAAIRTYESLGFREVDDYHITLFKESVSLK